MLPAEAKGLLASSGILRAAINCGNPVLAHRDFLTGILSGVTVDLAQEIARRLGVEFTLIPFDGAGKVVASARLNQWDIAFLAVDPQRAAEITYTDPYVLIEGAFAVRAASGFDTPASLDRAGVRIGVGNGAAYDLHLSRTFHHAAFVRYPTSAAVFPGFMQDNLDAAAGIRQPIRAFAENTPGVRIIPEPFMQIRQAIAVPKERSSAVHWLARELADLSRSGFVTDALARAGQDPALAVGL